MTGSAKLGRIEPWHACERRRIRIGWPRCRCSPNSNASSSFASLSSWRPSRVPAGETIDSKGDFAYEFFVIEAGSAEVLGDGRRLATLEPGDFFGEVGLLITGRRTASVVSLTPMRMIAMFEQSFRRLERELPGFAETVRTACMERFPRV